MYADFGTVKSDFEQVVLVNSFNSQPCIRII